MADGQDGARHDSCTTHLSHVLIILIICNRHLKTVPGRGQYRQGRQAAPRQAHQ